MRSYFMLAIALIAFITAAIFAYNIDKRADEREAISSQVQQMDNIIANDMNEQYTPVQSDPANLPALTGEECAAAGAEAGWSATWGPATDGCWLISPDGTQTRHVGTWKGE